jgi:hypothetical protein
MLKPAVRSIGVTCLIHVSAPRDRAYDASNSHREKTAMYRLRPATRDLRLGPTPSAIATTGKRMAGIRMTGPGRRFQLLRMVVLGALAAVALAGLPATPGRAAERPPVMGPNGGVSAGHPLTSAAAFEILARGGNAFKHPGRIEKPSTAR